MLHSCVLNMMMMMMNLVKADISLTHEVATPSNSSSLAYFMLSCNHCINGAKYSRKSIVPTNYTALYLVGLYRPSEFVNSTFCCCAFSIIVSVGTTRLSTCSLAIRLLIYIT